MTEENSFRIVSLNLANSSLDKKNGNGLGTRLRSISMLLRSLQPDVVLLQEARYTEWNDQVLNAYHIANIIAQGVNLEVAMVSRCNPTEACFAQITLYNPARLFPCKMEQVWGDIQSLSSPSPDPRGSLIQLVEFKLVSEGRSEVILYDSFQTVNVHYPVGPVENKFKVNHVLKTKVPESKVPTLIMGDYNTFFDDGSGQLQLSDLRQTFAEVSAAIESTFTAFPYDSILKEKNVSEFTSKLDHAFLWNPKSKLVIRDCQVASTLQTRESDHYALYVDVVVRTSKPE
jgi:endonuclease/exonuclease/phosphatase family metal-dependent hydrolase